MILNDRSRVEFYTNENIKDFRYSETKKEPNTIYCLLLNDIFRLDNFPILINQAYGFKNVILIGFTNIDSCGIDYRKMTTIADDMKLIFCCSFFLGNASKHKFHHIFVKGLPSFKKWF